MDYTSMCPWDNVPQLFLVISYFWLFFWSINHYVCICLLPVSLNRIYVSLSPFHPSRTYYVEQCLAQRNWLNICWMGFHFVVSKIRVLDLIRWFLRTVHVLRLGFRVQITQTSLDRDGDRWIAQRVVICLLPRRESRVSLVPIQRKRNSA